ncbi:MAG: DUF6754 domain-containing protein [bacterium]
MRVSDIGINREFSLCSVLFLTLLGLVVLILPLVATSRQLEVGVADSAHSSSPAGARIHDGPDEIEIGRTNSDWFHRGRVNVLVVVAVFFSFVLILTSWAKKGRELLVREIPGIQAVGQAIGRAAEVGRPVVYVPGVFDVDNIQTIASMAILVEVAKRAAKNRVRLIVPLNRAFLIPLAEESVKRGMHEAGRPEAYDPDNIRYLSDDHFAYAAAVDGIMLRERPAATFYLGGFGAEALILAEMGHSAGAMQIAGTAETQQLPFFVAACDHTLIGEEFYAASAYISKEPKLLSSLKAADVVKAVVIVLLILGSILELFGIDTISGWFAVQ